MTRLILNISVVLAIFSGCAESPAPPEADAGASQIVSPATSSVPAIAEVPGSEAQTAALLAELTQAVRKFGVEKQKAPRTLQDLVTAGYLTALPPAPAGKKFAIDSQLRVYLADQ